MAAPSRGHVIQLKSKDTDSFFRITSEEDGTVSFKRFENSTEHPCNIGLKDQSSIKWNNGSQGDHVLRVDGSGNLMFKSYGATPDHDLGQAAVNAAIAVDKTTALASTTKTIDRFLKHSDDTNTVKNYYAGSDYDARSIHGQFYTDNIGTVHAGTDVDIKLDEVKLVDVLQYAASLEQKIKEMDALLNNLLISN